VTGREGLREQSDRGAGCPWRVDTMHSVGLHAVMARRTGNLAKSSRKGQFLGEEYVFPGNRFCPDCAIA